jgi:predicted metal-dependent phosphoesterase TrpH
MPARYDLHTHSLRSDGTSTPAEIAAEAAVLGLAGFSLTDHDTTGGWSEARAAAHEAGIDFLPGIEITTKHDWRSTHLLAYGIDPAAPELTAALDRVRSSRQNRARDMVTRLAVDYDLDWESVIALNSDRTVGRPHLADALVEAGFFSDRSVAFAEVLHPQSRYYVPTYAIDTLDAIRLVREAGGVPVLAHPAAGRMTRPVDLAAIEEFVAHGLWGIELDHPENRTDWIGPLQTFAAEHALHVTGASDYHGSGKPNLLGERTSTVDTWQAIRDLAAVKH